jgi:hypothetical protein
LAVEIEKKDGDRSPCTKADGLPLKLKIKAKTRFS